MRLLTVSSAALLSSALALAACGGPSDGGQQESEIQGGASDTSRAHNFAVGITNELGGVCSGTLIAPNLVLTARHCVVPPSNGGAVTCSDRFPANVVPSALSITTEPNLYRATLSYAATEIVTPTDTAFCGNDIALIILEKAVPENEAKTAIPVVQFKLTDARLSGSITAMGYGITNPSAEDSGQRRVRENIPLVCIPGSSSIDCSGDLAKYSEDAAEFVTEGYVCSGDSGSGAFDQKTFARGTPYVLGALSRGPQSEGRCLAAIYSRTDSHKELIVDAAMKAAEKGNYAPPAWTVPEPPSAANESPGGTPCEGADCGEASGTGTTAAGAPKTTTTTSGCAVSPGGLRARGDSTMFAGLAVAAALAARRRRSTR